MNIIIGNRARQIMVMFENEDDDEAIDINGQSVTIFGLDIDTTNPAFVEAITAARNAWEAHQQKLTTLSQDEVYAYTGPKGGPQGWMSVEFDAKNAIKAAVEAIIS